MNDWTSLATIEKVHYYWQLFSIPLREPYNKSDNEGGIRFEERRWQGLLDELDEGTDPLHQRGFLVDIMFVL